MATLYLHTVNQGIRWYGKGSLKGTMLTLPNHHAVTIISTFHALPLFSTNGERSLLYDNLHILSPYLGQMSLKEILVSGFLL